MKDRPKEARSFDLCAVECPHAQARRGNIVEDTCFRALVQNLSDAIVILDDKGVRQYVSPASKTMLGYEPEELVGRSSFEIMHPDDVDRLRNFLKEFAQKPGETVSVDLRTRHRDGSWRALSCTCQNLLHDPAIAGIVVNTRDVTERRRAEEALQERERRFRALVQNLSDVITIVDPDGTRRYASPAIERWLGYAPEEMLGRSIFESVHPEDLDRVRSALAQCAKSPGGQVQMELRARRRDGSWRFFESTATNLIHEPAIGGIVLTTRDVTERREAEEALRHSEERFRRLVQNALDMIVMCDAEGRLEFVSPACERLLGLAPEELKGRHWAEGVHPEDLPKVQEAFERTLASPPDAVVWVEYRGLHRDGSWRVLESLTSNHLENPAVRAIIGNVRDVTEARKAREAAARAEKMESIGILAGGVAHDFNNLLGALDLNLSLAEQELDSPGPRLRGFLAEAQTAVARARGLARQLMELSRGTARPARKEIRLDRLIRETANLCIPGAGPRCVVDLPGDLWPVFADEGQIGQVLANLVLNARQAMPETGKIHVEAENVTLAARDAGLGLQAGRYVKISVRDQGPGIPEDNLSKIFDPYFTTRPGGSGLGLAVSRSILEAHGGALEAASEPGRGATFTMYVPVSDNGRPAVSERVPAAGTAAVARPSVLVVDDDERVRSALCHSLAKMGCRVECCEEGGRAIDLYREAFRRGAGFDVVLLDVSLPGGLDGAGTLAGLRAVDPGVKVIVCSGQATEDLLGRYREQGLVGALVKPFRFEQLEELLCKVLATGEAGIRGEAKIRNRRKGKGRLR
jgi:PAS domain S-box-containing protein